MPAPMSGPSPPLRARDRLPCSAPARDRTAGSVRGAVFALVAVILVAGLLPLPAFPVEETRPLDLESLGAPSFESFTARDGLPDGVITAIGVDEDGFAWATSPRGLYRFVGLRSGSSKSGPGIARRIRRDSVWSPGSASCRSSSRSRAGSGRTRPDTAPA